MSILYEKDFYQWLQETTEHIRQGNWEALDRENLIEELETMGRSERKEIKSRLFILLTHLLKWKYQPTQRSGSWIGTIGEQRARLEFVLEESPSLKNVPREILPQIYQKSRQQASKETGLEINTFPQDIPFTIEEILNLENLPE